VAIKVPANGYLVSATYGRGWECERGYRVTGEDCVVVRVPENGYFINASHGPGWRCEYGFQAVDESCVALKLPETAHIDYSGNGWDCNRPYRQQGGRCVLP
ncbi:MAG: hypothetical protein P8Z76_18700, partial [Alphaproteobacteria bacterium]